MAQIWRGSDQANAETVIDGAGTLNCKKGQQGGILFAPVCATGPVTHALTRSQNGATEDDTGRGTPIVPHEVTGTLSSRSSAGGGLGTDFEVAGGLQVTGTLGARASSGGGFSIDFEVAGGLQPTPTMAVRRLLPVETERLQGFPDSWTDIPWRGKPAPDGPRYKAMGNSFAVPVVRWIGQRLDAVAKSDR